MLLNSVLLYLVQFTFFKGLTFRIIPTVLYIFETHDLRLDLDCLSLSGSPALPAETQRSTGLCVQIRLLWPAAGRGGHRPDPRLPRALQGSARLPTASHGSSRLPVRAAVSFAYVAVTGDVLSLSLWEECRSNYVGGPETRLQVCVCVCVS